MDSTEAWIARLCERACVFNVTQCGAGRVLRDRAALEGACGRPFAGFAGRMVYESVPAKAVALLVGVAKAHPFDDGNKRTAWAVMVYFLRLLNYGCDGSALSPTAVEGVVIGLITGEVSEVEATRWLARHLVVLSP